MILVERSTPKDSNEETRDFYCGRFCTNSVKEPCGERERESERK